LRASIAALRTCGEIAPLIALDQEGGRVARITDPALVTQLPSPMALAATGDTALCEQLARRLGRDLARLGVSVDFAPCADLALDPRNTVIGTRSFGASPQAVAGFAGAFARGLEGGGVAAAIKHFPGHGATHVDSHAQLPRIDVAAATLRTRDLVPFASAIAGAAASLVMTAHIVVNAFDPAAPATLSAAVLTGLLRDELGFDGVIVTDCLEMAAIAATVGVDAGAVRALRAGADLLLVSHHLESAEAAARALVAAIETGSLALERLEAAAGRVRRLRERFAEPVNAACAAGAAGSDSLPETAPTSRCGPQVAAQRAVTRVRGDLRLRPDTAVSVISFEGSISDGAGGTPARIASLSAALRSRRWKSELMRVALEPEADDLDVLLALLPALGDRNFVIVMRRAHLYPAQRAAIERILAVVPDAIVISAREPYDAGLFDGARNVACIYGDEEISLEGCADVLSGRAAADGRLPVAIERVAGVR
jgi:beta-N-acetylhexosaminidase